MKKINYFLITLVIFMFTACSDMELGEPISSEYYYKLYGCYYDDYFTSVMYSSDDNTYISGYIVTTDTTFATMRRADEDGMEVWDTTLTLPFTKTHKIYFNEDDNTVYCLISEQASDDSAAIHLLKISNSGEFGDTISYSLTASAINSMEMACQEDGTFRIFAQIDVTDDADEESVSNYIEVLDYENGVIEEKIYYTVDQDITGDIVIYHVEDDYTYLAVTVSEDLGDATYTDFRLMFVDDMAVTWDRSFGTENVNETVADIMKYDDGIAIAGNYKGTSGGQKIIVYFANTNGIETGSVTTGIEDFDYDITTNSFCLNNYGNFVFTGYMYTGLDMSDIFFLETSASGEQYKYNSYGSEGQQDGENIGMDIQYDEQHDRYLLGGILEPITNTDICIFSLDKDGEWDTRD